MVNIILTILVALIICILLYLCAFRKRCFRIREVHRMLDDGTIYYRYIVEQYNSFLVFHWWLKQESGYEFSNGSEFTTMKDAKSYIKSLKYNGTKHEVIHDPICFESDK